MNVLILGATSDIAENVAHIYASRGARLYLVARNPDALAKLASELGPAVVGSEAVDFTDYRPASAAVERALTALGALDVALLCQGYLGDQLESERDFDEARRQIEVNFMSAVAQLIPLAQHVERNAHGTLAVITSVAGERGRPRNYTYGAAKGALTLYLQGLRSRLWGKAHVVTIKLGPVDTKMTTHHKKNAAFATIAGAARGIVRAIDRRAGEVYVPGFWRFIMAVVRNMPEAIFQKLNFLSGR